MLPIFSHYLPGYLYAHASLVRDLGSPFRPKILFRSLQLQAGCLKSPLKPYLPYLDVVHLVFLAFMRNRGRKNNPSLP